MCHASKNVYNASLYNIRQHFFQQHEFLRYEANYHLMKDSDCYNYLGNVSQQTMKAADNAFKAFFALLKLAKQAVEIAIGEGEETALKFLKENENG